MFPSPPSRRARKRPTSTLSFVRYQADPYALADRIAKLAEDRTSIFWLLRPEHRLPVSRIVSRMRAGYHHDDELAALLELRRSEFPTEFRSPE